MIVGLEILPAGRSPPAAHFLINLLPRKAADERMRSFHQVNHVSFIGGLGGLLSPESGRST